uniref:Uncharacterized protein n=1 Tax=Anguilla anguilla TaxID=7936 RepID=A0A0E9VI64_ANGAN
MCICLHFVYSKFLLSNSHFCPVF